MLLKKSFLEKRKRNLFVNEANTTERKIVLIQFFRDKTPLERKYCGEKNIVDIKNKGILLILKRK